MPKTIFIDNSILTEDKKKTYITVDFTSGTSVTVQSINGFSTMKNLLIGELGQEEAEIIASSTATAPSGSTIYLQTEPTYDHSVDTKIYSIDWNQVVFGWAAVATGAASTLTTIGIQPDQPETQYTDTSKTSGYYYTRFKDSVNNIVSDWSDPIPYGGYADNTVWAIKDRALKKIDAQIDDKITHDWLNQCLWEARREFHNAPGKRPFRRKYNQDIGNVGTGDYRVAVPNDLEDPTSARNVYGVRIGQNNIVSYYDKKDFDEDYREVAHSVLLYPIGATSVTSFSVADGRDFDSSGVVTIEDDEITYTAKDISTGSFTIALTGTTHTANADVWQGISFGLPTQFTVFQNSGETAYIYFNCPIETAYVDQNIWADYYRTLVPYDSDADVLDEPDYDMYVSYLAWRIRKKLKPDLNEMQDSDFIEWQRRKSMALNNEYLGTEISFYPDINA